jgi:ribonuclease T2
LFDRQAPVDPRIAPIGSREAVVPVEAGYSGEYVLAITWHPAFCETKPRLTECRNEQASDYAASHFSLHGLWPRDDQYCGLGESIIAIDETNRWDDLPEIDVSDATWRNLSRLMPGTEDSLERHEWVVHGTCAGANADTYFSRSVALVEEINASAVQELFARNIGRQVSRNQIRAAFDAAFGEGAGRKVRADCEEDGNREIVVELRINLEGDAMAATNLRDLIHAASNAGAGCGGGTVDRVGEQ